MHDEIARPAASSSPAPARPTAGAGLGPADRIVSPAGDQPHPPAVTPGPELASGVAPPLEALLDSLSEGLIIATPGGAILTANQAALGMHGWASAAEARTTVAALPARFDLREPDGRALALDEWPLARALRGEAFADVEVVVRHRQSGDETEWSCTATPVAGAGGTLALVVLAVRDVTQQRRAEDAVQRSLGRLARLQRTTEHLSQAVTPREVAEVVLTHGVPAVGARGGAAWALEESGATLALLASVGCPPRVVEMLEQVALADETPVADAVKTARAILIMSAQEWQARYPVLAALPEPPPAAVVVFPLVIDSRPIGALAFAFDMPAALAAEDRHVMAVLARQAGQAFERARLYEAEQSARARAETASRLKDEFLATLSHELRTPLNAMLGWAHLLRQGGLPPPMAPRAIETIVRNAEAQSRLIADVLDVSRIISGRMPLAMAAVELAAVVRAALDAVRPAAQAKAIALELTLVAEPTVYGDPDRLQQVFWNLLSNAVKFTPEGGRVDVELVHRDPHVEVTVRDTGIGIRPEFLPHVFERFTQADGTTARRHQGLGLGLAIVRHLVELHGGQVRADSDGEGCGATFTVALPMCAVRTLPLPPPAEAACAAAPDRAPDRLLAGLHVLVVDDEEDARDLLETVLARYGAEVTLAMSARHGLEALERLRPDVLLADIGMPGESGYDLIRWVRDLPPDRGGGTPAAALTAYGRAEDRLQALAAGFQQHIPKPVRPDELALVVAALAGRMSQS